MIALFAVAAPALALAGVIAGAAQDEPPAQLPQLSIEELLTVSVEPVFGASDRLQPVTEAPSSVTIVSAEEIRRYGYRSLGDILRAVRGFVITTDRNYTYVGIRGFSRPGDYNSRVLLLVNGHKINDNIYDQAYIGTELGIDAGMFERVEIIRGPASSLYGTSAFFAVINIITKSGADIEGLGASVSAGSLGAREVAASGGRTLANGATVAGSVSAQQNDGVGRLYFPAFDTPDNNDGIAEGLDGERALMLYGQAAWRGFTLTATHGHRRKDVPTASYFTVFNHHRPNEHTTDARSMLHAMYDGSAGATHVRANVSLDHLEYDGVYPYAGDPDLGELPRLINYDFAVGRRWSAGVRATRTVAGNHTVTIGGEILTNVTQRQGNYYNDITLTRIISDQSSSQSAVFVQDEVRVRPWLILNGGLRHDRYERFARTTPRAAVIVLPSDNQSFKYLYGRAFRAPNAYELFYYSDASTTLRPESIGTHELVWERYFGDRLRTAAAAYHSSAADLISFALVDPATEQLGFTNAGIVEASGIEFEAEVRLPSGFQSVGSFAIQRSHDGDGVPLINWPRRLGEIRMSAPGPWTGSIAALEIHHIGPRDTLLGTRVAAYTLAHAAFTARLSSTFDLVATMRNVFNSRYADPASAEHVQDAIEQNGRTFRVGLRWHMPFRSEAGR